MRTSFKNFSILLLTCLVLPGCMQAYLDSVGGDADRNATRIFLTDYQTAWESVQNSLKGAPVEFSNPEQGIYLTKWVDNTYERNLVESYGGVSSLAAARFRVKVYLFKGFYNGERSVKVSVHKEQEVKNHRLDGWRQVSIEDAYEENTIIYRVSRLILMNSKIQKLDDEKKSKDLKSVLF